MMLYPSLMLSHLDANDRPQMVDVGDKNITVRTAHARAEVVLPPALAALLTEERTEISTKKGPVFNTAIVAGIFGAKRTAELIPLCHPLPLDDCKIEITAQAAADDGTCVVHIDCHARTSAKTGVEMEALTGATIAALTLYDMGKAVTQGIVIRDTRLIEKTGGKTDYPAR